MTTCVIQLDHLKNIYMPGDYLRGKVICTFSKGINTKGIIIKLKGKEHNKWTDTSFGKSSTYVGKNKFLRMEHILSEEGNLPIGSYEYRFSFQLPLRIPGSYKGVYGGINFLLEAVVLVSFGFNHKSVLDLPVLSLINLDLIKNQLKLTPTSYSEEKILCCWCCTQGSISMRAHVEKLAFISGEKVMVKVEIDNMSKAKVERVKTKVMSVVKSTVTHPIKSSKTNIEVLAVCEDTGVDQKQDRTYHFQLTLPSARFIPNFSGCELFSIESFIKVKAQIGGAHMNLAMRIPVQLGHILSQPMKY